MSTKENSQYNGIFGSAKGGEKRGFLATLFSIILLAITLSLSLALIIAYLTPHVPPALFGQFTIVGLFTPILYLMVAGCALIWVIMRRWTIVLISVVLLLPGVFYIGDFYNMAVMGAFLKMKPIVMSENIDKGLAKCIPARYADLISLNKAAIEEGMNAVEEL